MAQTSQGKVTIVAPNDELRDHRVVVNTDFVALRDPRINAHIGSFKRWLQVMNAPGLR